MKMNLSVIKKKVIPVLKEAGVTRSSIFGSTVKGKVTKDSDIDILIELPKDKSLFEFVTLQLKLEGVLGKKVDLVEYSTLKPRLKRYILDNQVHIL